MKNKIISWLKIGLFIVFLIFFDQLTKHLATIHLKGKFEDVTLIKNIVALKYLEGGNQGAAWGILSGKTTILIIFTMIAVIVIGIIIRNINYILVNNNSLKKCILIVLKYLFALLIAGALGNIIDRISNGYVVDFICFRFITFPTFNIADIYVTVSCVLIILLCIFKLNEDDFNQIFSLKKKR